MCPLAEGYIDALRHVIAESWRAMQGEKVVYPALADGARGLALIEAAVKSIRTRMRVSV